MYAIVQVGGQQFKVAKDNKITTNRLAGNVGDSVDLENVLLLSGDDGVKVGAPFVEGAKVQATILEHDKGKKVVVFKKKRRKGYRVLKGHRQALTTLQINEITA